MTPTPLTGFIIHSRPYQEKRAIYQLFSLEWGVVHGVGVRGVPSFVQVECFVTGKNSLKNFTQMHIKDNIPLPQEVGQNRYVLLYLNELIYKLIAPENPCPSLWHAYHQSVERLKTGDDLTLAKTILRQFETALFEELGVSVDWGVDSHGKAILPSVRYDFLPSVGFVPSAVGIGGEALLSPDLATLGQIHRAMIDYLLDYEPLNSRKLWAERLKYR